MSIIGFDASDVRQPLYSYTFLMLEVHEEHWYMPKVRIKKKMSKSTTSAGFKITYWAVFTSARIATFLKSGMGTTTTQRETCCTFF